MEVPPTIAGAGVGVSQAFRGTQRQGDHNSNPAGRAAFSFKKSVFDLYICVWSWNGRGTQTTEKRKKGRKSLEMGFE